MNASTTVRNVTKRYHLEDQGQDLNYIDICEGVIVGAGLFHNDLYAGMLSYDFYAEKTLEEGDFIRYSESPRHSVKTIKYPIVKVEVLSGGEA